MPVVDMLIDLAFWSEIMSFHDGYYGYILIYIAKEDAQDFLLIFKVNRYNCLDIYAIRLKNCMCYISKSNEYYFP